MRRSLLKLNERHLPKALRQALVLLTLLLLPSAAWGQITVKKTITFDQSFDDPISGDYIEKSTIPVSVQEVVGSTTYNYSSYVGIRHDNVINQYSYDSQAVTFTMNDDAVIADCFSILLPGNYPATPDEIKLTVAYSNAVEDDENEGTFAKIQVIDIENNDKIYIGNSQSLSETTLTFVKDGIKENGVDGQTNRESPGAEYIFVYLNGNEESPTTFTIKQVEITYQINENENYGISVTGIPVTSVNASAVLFNISDWNWDNPATGIPGKVSFTPAATVNDPNILTLNGAALTGPIETNVDLQINLVGSNSVTVSDTNGAIYYNGNGDNPKVTFLASGGGSLQLTNNQGGSYAAKKVDCEYEWGMVTSNEPTNSTNVLISPGYDLWVGGIRVKEGNKSGITGSNISSGTISFDSTNKILTLNNAKITDKGIRTGISGLIIDLIGASSVASDSAAIQTSKEAQTLPMTIRSTSSPIGSLKLAPASSYLAIAGFNITYENDLAISPSTLNVGEKAYIMKGVYQNIDVGGVPVSDVNAGDILGNGKVSFNTTSKTLTLNGVENLGSIYTTIDNLTINLKGTNSISATGPTNGIVSEAYPEGTLTITEDATVGGSLEITSGWAVIRGFETLSHSGLYFETKSPYKNETYGYYRTHDLMANDSTGIKWAKISSNETYPIWINEKQATTANVSDITLGGSSTSYASFDNAKNELTLNNITINGQIVSTLTSLGVRLIKNNTINPGEGKAPFKYAGETGTTAPSLSFVSSNAEAGDLTMSGAVTKSGTGSNVTLSFNEGINTNYTISTIFDDGYGTSNIGDWQYIVPSTDTHEIYYNVKYNLWVKYNDTSYQYSKANKNSIVYGPNLDTDQMALTITGSWNYPIISSLPNLTLLIEGSGASLPQVSFEPIEGVQETGTLTVKRVNDASEYNTFTVNNDNGAIIGFSEVIATSPMKLITPQTAPTAWDANTKKVVISDETFYDLSVNGVEVRSSNASAIKYDVNSETVATAVYTPGTNTLTFDNYDMGTNIFSGNAIETGIEGLIILIKNASSIRCSGNAFKATNENASITFNTDGDANSSLAIATPSTSTFNGFGSNKIAFGDGIGYLENGDSKFIKQIPAPGIESSDNGDGTIKITLSSEEDNYDNTKFYYSIVYYDNKGNVTDQLYTEPFNMTKPGTLTVYLTGTNELGKSKGAIGKFFGFDKESFSMPIYGELNLKEHFIPAIKEEEVSCYLYESEDITQSLINTEGAEITAGSNIGTTIVQTTFETSDGIVVLNKDGSPTATIYIGESLNSIFYGSNIYGTFYNNSDKTYKVPEGVTAKIVIDVDGDKVSTKETKVLPPNKPVLLERSDKATAFTYIEATDEDGSFPSETNLLLYAKDQVTVPENGKLYVLYNDMYVKATAGSIIDLKCYLDLSGTTASTRGFYNIGSGEGTTAIREVKNGEVNSEKWGNGEWFDIQGRHVAQPAKGLYIRNGKKVVIK